MKYLLRALIFLVLVWSVILRLNQLNAPLMDAYYFRQTQTATVARNFYEKGIDLLRPELDIFGVGKEKYLILESPLYQATVAMLAKTFGYSDTLGRLISIASGVASATSLYYIVFLLSKNKLLSLFSLIFFLFFPLNIFVQRTVLIESFTIMLHLLSLLLWTIFLKRRSLITFLTTILVTIPAVISKITYGPFLLMFMAVLGFNQYGKKLLFKKEILIFFLTVIVAIAIWQQKANQMNILSGQSFFTSANFEHWIWNTGTIADRLKLKAWTLRAQDILSALTKFSAVALIIGAVAVIIKKQKTSLFFLSWLLIMFLYYLIFFRIQSHIYYFSIATPSIAVLSSYGALATYDFFKKRTQKVVAAVLLVIFTSFFMYKGAKNALGYFVIHTDVVNKIETLNKYLTKPGPVVFIFPNWDWNSVYTYYTKRKGIVLTMPALSEIPKYQAQGYKYVVFMDFSPSEINTELLKKHNLVEKQRTNLVVITEITSSIDQN